MVLEEQQQQKYSNSNYAAGGGRPSKKLKQKKIPQRGLGVAQLEKIRLEEQQQKNTATGFPPPSFVLPLPPYHRQQLSSSFPASPSDLSSTSSLFGSPPSSLNLPTPPLPPPLQPTPPFQTIEILNGSHQGGSTSGSSSSTTSTGQGHNSRIWNNGLNYNGDVEITGLDHRLPCQTQLQKEASYSIRHSLSPIVIDRKQPRSSTMVHFPPLTSCGLGLPLELPSNQSIRNNKNYREPSRPRPWPDEEKMVGGKRPWPFSLDNLQLPPSLSKIPSIIKPIYRPEESSLSSNGNGSIFKFEPANSIISQSTSIATVLPIDCKGTTSEVNHKNGVSKENRILEGDFLTLGPPAVGSSSMGSKSNKQQHLTSLEFDSPPSSLGSIEEPPVYSFFPPEGQISRVAATTNHHQRVEDSGTVDLNLKL